MTYSAKYTRNTGTMYFVSEGSSTSFWLKVRGTAWLLAGTMYLSLIHI